jgi:hypothetical protein
MTSNQLILAVVAAIIISVVLVSMTQNHNSNSFSKIITVGPVWTGNTWSCTSNDDFLVHGALRGLQGSTFTISISGLGTQSLYSPDEGKMQSFSIGSPGGHTMNITRTGIVTGWITLQTMSNAKANCTQT